MDEKWIAFYISSHGFGHMTRCLAIMEKLLASSDYSIYLVCDAEQIDFARLYLDRYSSRLRYSIIRTDVGLLNCKDSLRIDIVRLHKELHNFISRWDAIVQLESAKLAGLPLHCVVTDISPLGALIGKRLQVKTLGISNFTWVQQYEALGIDPSLVQAFRQAYAGLDRYYAYDLAVPPEHFPVLLRPVGFVSREIDQLTVAQIRKFYGPSLYITCGKAARLKPLRIRNFTGIIFATSGIEIDAAAQVVLLPNNVLDTQNYVAASTLVIAKAGWSTIAEALIAGTPLVLIERPDVHEDSQNIAELKRRKAAISISEDELADLDIRALTERLATETLGTAPVRYPNQAAALAELILQEADGKERSTHEQET